MRADRPLRNLLEHGHEALAAVREARTGLFVDFDGTISEFVVIPAQATVSPLAAAALQRLTGPLPLVCVISGRAVADLRDRVGVDGVVYVGNHGAEQLDSGTLTVAPTAAEHSHAVTRLVDGLKARVDIPGVIWDDKLYSASVHFRAAKEPERVKDALQAALNAEPDTKTLQVFWGKRVLEIRPPRDLNKGDALKRLVAERRLSAAIFVGDDTTDVDAMVALRELGESDGFTGLGVAVADQDTPPGLVEAADFTLRGVPEVAEFLEWLAKETQ